VDATQIQVRRLTSADAALYRDIRLEGLRCSPEAFGSTFEAENARPLTSFSELLGGRQRLALSMARNSSPSLGC
jgi:hypothetical protein